MVFHVRVTKKSNRTSDSLGLDLTEKDVAKIVKAYHEGQKFMLQGEVIDPFDVEKIKINETKEHSSQLIPKIREQRSQSKFVAITLSDEWYVTEEGADVTDKFIEHPPIKAAETKPKQQQAFVQAGYKTDEDIERAVMNYLVTKSKESKLDIRDLSFWGIEKQLIDIDKKRLKKILKKLEEENILRLKSNIEIYVPNELAEEENLLSLRLGDPLRRIKYAYAVGVVTFALLYYLAAPFREWTLTTFDFAKPDNILVNSIFIGLFFPLALGGIIYLTYDKVVEALAKIGKTQKLLVGIILSYVATLFGYVVLTVIFNYNIDPSGIYVALGLGTAISALLVAIVSLHSRKEGD